MRLLSLSLVLVWAVVLSQAIVTPITFDELKSDKHLKLVLFHDPDSDVSRDSLSSLEDLSEMKEFVDLGYRFQVCDTSLPPNHQAKTNKLEGSFFTHTPEAGIASFGKTLTIDGFREFHNFRSLVIEEDNVHTVDNIEDIFKLTESKPVFLKMFEQWCGHCKHMKKHFQAASQKDGQKVHFVEVECSASVHGGWWARLSSLWSNNPGDTCGQFGVRGYPTVKLLAKIDGKYMVHDYKGARTFAALQEFGSDPFNAAGDEWSPYSGYVPEKGSSGDDKEL